MKADISTKAMLVSLEICTWTARKADKEVSDKVADENEASRDAGRYWKALVAKDAISKIRTIAGAARNTHYEFTLPWAQDGARILPATMYWKYEETMRGFRDQFEEAVREFLTNYEQYVQAARFRLKKLFKEGDYPSSREIASKFSFQRIITPLPDASDFRVDLSKGEVDRIKKEIEGRMQDTLQDAVRDVWDRLHRTLAHIADRLDAYKVEDGKVRNPFRDSLVTNLNELVDLLPKLNLTGDAKLSELTKQVSEKLTGFEAQDLRDDEKLRRQVARDTKSILDNMAGYMAAA